MENLNKGKVLLFDGTSSTWGPGTTITLNDDVRNYAFLLVIMSDGKVSPIADANAIIRDIIPLIIPVAIMTHKENNRFPYVSINSGQPSITEYTIHFALTEDTYNILTMGMTGRPSMRSFKIYGLL